jgi:uroporphyrinogen decarboxylase
VVAGASALQVFDPWVGTLAPAVYRANVLPHMRQLFARLADLDVPAIHFGVGTSELLEAMAEAGGEAIGVDHRIGLDRAWGRIGPERAIQGNLDPAVALAPWEHVEREALDVLARAGGRPGHVFNLGHGVLPDTPVGNLQRLVDLVHARTERDG